MMPMNPFAVSLSRAWNRGKFVLAPGWAEHAVIVIEYDEETDTVKCIEVYPNPDHAKEGNIENTTLEEIEDWSPGPIYFVNVTGATSDQREDAVDFAEQQLKEKEGSDWNSILWPRWRLLGNSRKQIDWNGFYCTEIVWAAYKQAGVDIDYTPDNGMIWGTEIKQDSDTKVEKIYWP